MAIFGRSFKPRTDDLRESPMVELAERVIGKGFNVKVRSEPQTWVSSGTPTASPHCRRWQSS